MTVVRPEPRPPTRPEPASLRRPGLHHAPERRGLFGQQHGLKENVRLVERLVLAEHLAHRAAGADGGADHLSARYWSAAITKA